MKTRIFLAAALLASSSFAQSVIINSPGKKALVAIRNATIVPVTSAAIPNGTIVFDHGVITAVGANVATNAPAASPWSSSGCCREYSR